MGTPDAILDMLARASERTRPGPRPMPCVMCLKVARFAKSGEVVRVDDVYTYTRNGVTYATAFCSQHGERDLEERIKAAGPETVTGEALREALAKMLAARGTKPEPSRSWYEADR